MKNKTIRRVLTFMLCIAFLLPVTVSLVGDSGKAEALTSLPYIETLKSSAATFNILEIVPADGQGSIGYYIDGQEPCADWVAEAAKRANASGPADRTHYVNNTVFADLVAAGILGDGDTTPLKSAGAYSEVYPWEAHSGYAKMTLDHTERATAYGTFVLSSSGEYNLSTGFILGAGDYVQVIDYFNSAQSDNLYYYNLKFSPVAGAPSDGTAIYEKIDGDYEYIGTVGKDGFQGMETAGVTYYYVSDYSKPYPSAADAISEAEPDYTGDNAAAGYAAVSSSFRRKTSGETGYFYTSGEIYTYVGIGGAYSFISGGSTEKTIDYDTVFYTGGYTNNNWFLRYVFDWTPGTDIKPSVKLKVTSVAGSSVSSYQVDQADMIVLSNGFVPNGDAAVYGNDISKDVYNKIYNSVFNTGSGDQIYNMPVIVDYRLTSSAFYYLNKIANDLKSGSYNNYVKNSVFFFNPDANRTALATQNFCKLYNTSDYALEGSAFYPAYDVIVYENFIRQQKDPASAALEPKINMARAIRYIINYANQRVKGLKASLKVLELEPGSLNLLTASTVAGWTGYDEADITIEHMSTLEFVGKNDDLIENYDIIYVGDNGGASVDKLDSGYLYENIGKEVQMRADAAGLTDAEYSSTVFLTNGGKSYYALGSLKNTRYSGNDLSTKKLNDLNEYAVSGHPVIIASGLTSGTVVNGTSETTFTVTISGTQSGTSAVLTASINTASGELPASAPKYQWYKGSSAISGATSATYVTTSNGTYYCTVTYTVNGTAYTATSNSLTCTKGSSYTLITNDTSSSTSGSFGFNASQNYTVSVSASKTGNMDNDASNTFTASVSYGVLPAGAALKYEWHRMEYGVITNFLYEDITLGSDSPTLVADMTSPGLFFYYVYVCYVNVVDSSGATISTTTGQGNAFKVAYQNSRKVRVSNYGRAVTGVYSSSGSQSFAATVTPNSGTASSTQTLTATPSISAYATSYQWYIDGALASGQTRSTLSVTNSSWADGTYHTYYCKVTKTAASSGTAITNTVTLTRIPVAFNFTDNGGGTSKTIPAQEAQKFTINASKVDNCSNMYAFLNGNKSRYNVMRSTDIDSAALLRYINLSKPTLNIASKPEAYSWSGTGTPSGLTSDPDGTYTLEYEFTISNATDSTPADTRYYCNLYIDTNNDSRFVSQERIGSISISEAATGVSVDSGELKADTQYKVTRTMPSDWAGYIYWKLEVVKVNEETTHASQTGNTYIKPEAGKAEVLNILQINTGRTSGQTYGYGTSPYGGLSLDNTGVSVTSPNSGIAATRNTILGLIDAIASDYDINIQTITTTQANNISTAAITNKLEKDNAGNYTNKSYTNIDDFLDTYDMLIIGFDDAYNELSRTTSVAIVNYLNEGHPILYSHDTTSMPNVPEVYARYSAGNSKFCNDKSYYFGYYFNNVLRDPLGLDRYGVTDAVYGGTSKSNPYVSKSGIVASGYAGLGTAVTKKDLQDAGYSIAYLPGSNASGAGGTPIGTTQGLTNYTYTVSGDGNLDSTAVTQLNKGMITTYPYDVNTTAFGGSIDSISTDSISTMGILNTHQQYYQANMNPDDVVVWYCLSGSGYQYNDASNAYYIFSNGNATYSGFGHSLSNIDLPEAKLFVNSIIAAYRITNYAPEIKFTDYRGKNSTDDFLIPYDGDVSLYVQNSTDETRRIYLTVEDVNVGKNKLVSAIVSLNNEKPYDTLNVPIYDSQTDKQVDSTATMVSGLVYYIKIDEVIIALKNKNIEIGDTGTPIYVVATTKVHGAELTGNKALTLRRLELFPLA